MTEFPQIDSSLDVPVFNQGDDLIAYLNKAMAFLTAIASSRFPSTNNQLRTFSNLRNQATIQDDRVIVQQVQGRQGQSYYGTGYKGNATSSRGNNTGGGKGKGNTEDLDAYDSDCDDVSNAKAVLMANLFNYGFDVILEEKLALKKQIDSLKQNLSNQIKEKESLLQTFTVFKNESKEKESKYMENEIDLEKKIKELDDIVYKVDVNYMFMNSTAVFDDEHLEMQSSESCVKCLDLDAELLNKQNAYNDLSKSCSQLEKHCISLELTMQLNQEIFQKDSLSNNQNALEILEYFENNDLKAQL
ncbi:hypothetical protein Tco_0938285 [Tanacetum coccineum]|uniref:Uncharacterized protein n=1 Tax=Tanacetum coccineum TaxID=301880 RepID=A0ABQ5DGN8_9ASTR